MAPAAGLKWVPVTVTVVPDSIRGKVKIGNESWSASAGEVIQVGAKVEVVSSEGVHVQVERIEDIARWEAQQRTKEQA